MTTDHSAFKYLNESFFYFFSKETILKNIPIVKKFEGDCENKIPIVKKCSQSILRKF